MMTCDSPQWLFADIGWAGMRAWINVEHGEDRFVTAARLATHQRTHDATAADFFIVESSDLIDLTTGALIKGKPVGHHVGQPAPRFEIQILDSPVEVAAIGSVRAVCQTVDSSGRVESFTYAYDPNETFLDEFREFLLTLGETPEPVSGRDRAQPSESIEEFLTLWALVGPQVPFDPETRRIAEAIVTMAGEVMKTSSPPRPLLRSAFEWLGSKLNRFSDEFSTSAGKAAGAAFGASAGFGAGAFVAGRLPQLLEAVEKVLRHL